METDFLPNYSASLNLLAKLTRTCCRPSIQLIPIVLMLKPPSAETYSLLGLIRDRLVTGATQLGSQRCWSRSRYIHNPRRCAGYKGLSEREKVIRREHFIEFLTSEVQLCVVYVQAKVDHDQSISHGN